MFSSEPLDYCENVQKTHDTMQIRGFLAAVSVISMVTSLAVAATIFYNKKLSQHPSKLIGYMCLAEGLSCFNAMISSINTVDFICYFGLHYIFSWSTFEK